jgi:hemerythrin-like domain-containing protein
MLPIGPLMIEHRLIEQVITFLGNETANARLGRQMQVSTVDTVVDFVRVYADRTHHGKEEEILFRDLQKKQLSIEDSRIMRDLEQDHRVARQLVKDIVDAKRRFEAGNELAMVDVLQKCDSLVDLYPDHIRKEDKIFFPSAMRYFSQQELAAMLEEMWQFDRKMIHEKYRQIVECMLSSSK